MPTNDVFWQQFGFVMSPYRTTALEANESDVNLFTERDDEKIKYEILIKNCDSSTKTIIISGNPGIGKTSFVNMQQLNMSEGNFVFAPKLIPCINFTTIMPGTSHISLVKSIVFNTIINIKKYCQDNKIKFPNKINEIDELISTDPKRSSASSTVLGSGGGQGFTFPDTSAAFFEQWFQFLIDIENSVRNSFDVDGLTVCIDNLDTLDLQYLLDTLNYFRDNLFQCKNIWWILIGQSHLLNIIKKSSPRLSERINGGIELEPFDKSKFHNLIERRMKYYRNKESFDEKTPLNREIHDFLFDANPGQIRYALSKANELVQEVENIASTMGYGSKSLQKLQHDPHKSMKTVFDLLLISNGIKNEKAYEILHDIVWKDIEIDPKIIQKFKIIYKDKGIKLSDFKKYGYKSSHDLKENLIDFYIAEKWLIPINKSENTMYRLYQDAWIIAALECMKDD